MGSEHVKDLTLYFPQPEDLALIFHLISDSPNLMVCFLSFVCHPPFIYLFISFKTVK